MCPTRPRKNYLINVTVSLVLVALAGCLPLTVQAAEPVPAAAAAPAKADAKAPAGFDERWTEHSKKQIAASEAAKEGFTAFQKSLAASTPEDCRIWRLIRIVKEPLGPVTIATKATGSKDYNPKKYSEIWQLDICGHREKWQMLDSAGTSYHLPLDNND